MLHAIIVIAFVVVMAVMGASPLELAIACGMTAAWVRVLAWSEVWVQRRTGRTSLEPTDSYKGASFLVAMLIGLPPIFLLPHPHYLALVAFQMVGMLIGGICAQSIFGKRVA